MTIGKSILDFGLFTSEHIDEAKEEIAKEYSGCSFKQEEVEVDVIRIHKADKPFMMIDLKDK